MVVTGIEIVALVAALISGFDSARQLVHAWKEGLQKARQKKTSRKAKFIKRLDEFEESLAESITTLQRKYTRHCRVLGSRFQTRDAEASKSLNRVAGLQQDLFTVFRQNLPDLKDIDEQEAWVNRTETFRNNAMSVYHQHFERFETHSEAKTSHRPSANYSVNLCVSAIAYRENHQPFENLTYRVGGGEKKRWDCVACGESVSRASMAISANMSVWIGPSGLFKAHCEAGRAWMCIWESDTEECQQEFASRKDLLVHMAKAHTRQANDGGETSVDLPAGQRRKGIQYCGYGVRIGDLEMIESEGRFVVRAQG